MNRKRNVYKSYYHAVKALREVIELPEYDDGGWLPAEREMGQRLEMSNLTYRKAIKAMHKEGFLEPYPRRGCWVNAREVRVRKVGIVVGGGEESPFFGVESLPLRVMEALQERNVSWQIIQGRNMAELPKQAFLHGVAGLVWINPDLEEFFSEEVQEEHAVLPQLLLSTNDSQALTMGFAPAVAVVRPDYAELGRMMAGFALGFKPRTVAYAGSSEFAQRIGLNKILNDAGISFGLELCTEELESFTVAKKLLAILDSQRVDLLFCEGGGNVTDAVFAVLSRLPEGRRPVVCCRNNGCIEHYANKYPQVTLRGVVRENGEGVARIGAEMMVKHIFDYSPLNGTVVTDYYSVRTVEGES